MLKTIYDKIILKYPKWILTFIFIIVSFLGYQSLKLEIDASAETLILEHDKDLQFSRLIKERYHTPDFLIIAYTPENSLLSNESLHTIKKLSDEFVNLKMVESVTSILNVPLLESPSKPIKELLKDIPTLESAEVNKSLAEKEFLNSPIYKNNLVSTDFKTTALILNLKEDQLYYELLKRKNELRYQEKDDLEKVLTEFKKYRDVLREKEHQNIKKVREIMNRHKGEDELFLGGVSMIADDMIGFVKSDLKIYGTTVFVLLIIILWIIFRELRWVLIPIIILILSVVSTCGLLGMYAWEVTVISSNFISLQLIITMSIIIHLIVRYRELTQTYSKASQHELVLNTMLSMAKPCFFAIVTTIVGFSSLMLCDILPVINFGWMMSAGIAISLFITFLVFPAILIQMPRTPANTFFETHFSLIKIYENIAKHYGKTILFTSTAIFIFSIIGSTQLMVENSFINYFKKSTEIYQGMKIIDQKLGGTTPLDVIYDFKEGKITDQEIDTKDEFALFEEEFEEAKSKEQYWFTSEKMEKVTKIHNYLETIPFVGNVQSLGVMLEVGKSLNNGKPLDDFKLAMLYNELPEHFKEMILNPYVDIENNQVRFALRIIDSQDDLRRDALLKQIKKELKEKVGLESENIHLSNLMVLYNNMLQSLFDSQILTIGIVILALFVMFFILFQSLKIAFIAMVSNIIPIGVVFGFMGWTNIPLDMMTITIAAISIGIGVDDTIHYIHRYKLEYAKDKNYYKALERSHNSVGYAMYYTSFAIMIGFSILLLSNFIPTINFGFLTVLAMFMAMTANLLLLPRLIIVFKAMGNIE